MDPSTETHVAELERRALRYMVSDLGLASASVQSRYDIEFAAIEMRLEAGFLGIKETTVRAYARAEIYAPKTWWDHWKQDHPRLSRWLRLDEPNLEHIVKVDENTERVAVRLCPHIKVPDTRAHFEFMVRGPQRWESPS